MTYDHSHPDSDLFNEKTLGDYLRKKAPWPCVVVGGEQTKEDKDVTRQRAEKSED